MQPYLSCTANYTFPLVVNCLHQSFPPFRFNLESRDNRVRRSRPCVRNVYTHTVDNLTLLFWIITSSWKKCLLNYLSVDAWKTHIGISDFHIGIHIFSHIGISDFHVGIEFFSHIGISDFHVGNEFLMSYRHIGIPYRHTVFRPYRHIGIRRRHTVFSPYRHIGIRRRISKFTPIWPN